MLFLLSLACTPAPSTEAAVDAPTQVTLAGSSTVQPVAEITGAAYESGHPGAQVDVQGGGSSVGISSARSGLADIGMVSRALKPDEADLTATAIGLDGIALIVHATNPLSSVTTEQVVSIYTGAIAHWAALGWEDHGITLVNKEEGRSTLELFEHHFGLKGKVAAGALVIGPNGQAITTVAGNPYAIAYVSIGSATVAEEQGTAIKRLALDGLEANVTNVANASYPLMRPINLVTKGAPTGPAKAFIDYVLSAEGQALVAKEDFVPVRHASVGHVSVGHAPPAL